MRHNQQFEPLSKLQYRVVLCGSEDPAYPYTQLSLHSKDTAGWRTAKGAVYPVEVVLGFQNEVHVQEIQLLSHEYLTATKVEVWIGGSDLDRYPNIEECKWNRIGMFPLTDNSTSGYKARELRTVYINTTLVYLKLDIFAPHACSFNTTNQVGILAIDCLGNLGERYDPSEVPRSFEEFRILPSERLPLNTMNGKALQTDVEKERLQFERASYDDRTYKKLLEYAFFKLRAIQEEDFEAAKHFKSRIEEMKEVGAQIKRLEEQKRRAVAQEEFDLAKALKLQIDALRKGKRETPFPEVPIPPRNPPEEAPPARKRIHDVLDNDVPFEAARAFPATNELAVDSKDLGRPRTPAIIVKGNAYNDSLLENPDPFNVGGQKQNVAQEVFDPSILPQWAVRFYNGIRGKTTEVLEGPAKPHSEGKGSDEKPVLTRECESVFGEYCGRCLFSSNWRLREAALAVLQTAFDEKWAFGKTMNESAQIICKYCTGKGLNDTVLIMTASLKIIVTVYKLLSSRSDIIPIVECLSAKVIDTSTAQRVKEATVDVLMRFASDSGVGAGPVIVSLIEEKAKGKVSQDPRRNINRIQMLVQFVKSFTCEAFILEILKKRAIPALQHTHADVRAAGNELISVLYAKDPKEVINELKNHPETKRVIEDLTSPPDDDTPGAPVSLNPSQCDFCHAFVGEDEDLMDNHHVSECPLLTECICERIVEIRDLDSHRDRECTEHAKFKKCATCESAVEVSGWGAHQAGGHCVPRQQGVARCPLCARDIGKSSDENVWFDHLAVPPGCPLNTKRVVPPLKR